MLRLCYNRTTVAVIVVTSINKLITLESTYLHFFGHSEEQKGLMNRLTKISNNALLN